MGTLTMKKDDLEPKYTATLRNADGTPVDLTNATSVSLIVKQQGGAKYFKSAGAFATDRTTGVVSYTWASGNTDTVGTFQMEWEVIWPTNRPETFPNDGFDTLIIGPSLD